MPPLLFDEVNDASWALEEYSVLVVPGDYKVVAVTHTADSLDNLIFIVGDDLDSFEILKRGIYSELGSSRDIGMYGATHNSQIETPFCHVVGISL